MVYSSIPPRFVLSGWAKFTAADPSKGAWDGWVSLRGNTYGVCYGNAGDANGLSCKGDGATNSVLSGWAWGGDVTGWINFGVLIPPVLSSKVTSAADGKSVKLNWSNGMDYSRVEIWMTNADDPSCINPTSNQCKYRNYGGELDAGLFGKSTNGFDKTATVSGLNAGAKYNFFIRAYP